MKFIFSTLLVILIIASCAPGRQLTNLESNITQLYQQGNYNQVLSEYDRLEIMTRNSNDTISQPVSILAGKAAWHAGFYDQTHRYFEKTEIWQNNPDIVLIKGKSYQQTGNQQQEYQHWINHIDKIKLTDSRRKVMLRIFEIEESSGDYESALQTWNRIPDNQQPDIMFKKLQILEKTDRADEALALSGEILAENPDFEPAKFWKARFYYDKAENWYQDEMTKYNRNPNYTTYAYLRRELRLISADFRKSRDLFVELHEMQPGNVTYMQYLRNIYRRLEMRPEAARMDQLINNIND
ncbi:tetratricopeptide repeat protein [Alkalitalea saponilacus]|uniref:Tetratricopeptide repeat-containing protein n=1 Tax=Alkalitalea saponilacus TaxID=889453 RepID=A0A1T5H3T0_9BACT|nr:hypothetical protein [Alkalitalea saponilacus]ASB50897.1 hypothetical protein CDL62_17955 [Alkalitalea saponilacus]SKC15343.1 hypothetical protein SAMN03080601_02072 [Alkalitalea saponilacus]